MQNQPSPLNTLAGWSMVVSGVVAIFSILFLVLLYVGLFTGRESLYRFGPLNDLFVIIQYVLALPAVIGFYRTMGPESPRLSQIALASAVLGVIVVVVFQLLLLTGVMSFAQQVGFVSAGVLTIGVWILITSYLGRVTGLLPISSRLSFFAFFYFGYPVWAFRVGNFFLSS